VDDWIELINQEEVYIPWCSKSNLLFNVF
jgi:hypothetical protein